MQTTELVQLGAPLPTVAGRDDVADPHRQELGARIAVVGDGGVVDGEEPERRNVPDPHRLRVVLEQRPVAALGVACGLPGPLAVCELPTEVLDQGVELVSDGDHLSRARHGDASL